MTGPRPDNDVTEELSRLYELALSIGQQLDAGDTCRSFLRILVSRYDLTGASIWWRRPETAPLRPLAALPPMESAGAIDAAPDVIERVSGSEGPRVITARDPDHSALGGCADGDALTTALYPLGPDGVLVMRSGREATFPARLLEGLRPVLDALHAAIKGGIAQASLTSLEQTPIRQSSFLKTLIQTLPDLIWLKDPDGVYLACNNRFERFFGAAEAEILGKTDYDFVDPEQADFFRAHDRQAMQKGSSSVNEEWITFRDDGHRELLETTKTPMFDDDGELIGVLGIGHDITATRQSQRYERFRARILERLASNAPLADILTAIVRGAEDLLPGSLCSIRLLDEQGLHLGRGIAPSLPSFFNAEIDLLEIGSDAGPCVTTTSTKRRVIVPDIADYSEQSDYQALTHRAGLRACWCEPVVRPDGQTLGVFSLYRRTPSEPTRSDIDLLERAAGLVCIVIDRRHAEKALRVSEERLKYALTGANDGLWEWNLETDQIYYSPRWLMMLGYHPGDFPETLDTWAQLVHPQDRESALSQVSDYLEGRTGGFETELRMRHKDGHWVHVLSRGMLARDAAGEPVVPRRMVGTHMDISDRKRAEERLRESELSFRSLFDSLQEAVYVQDRDGRFLAVNKGAAQMYGRPREWFVGKELEDISAPERNDLEALARMHAEAFAGKPQSLEFWGIRADGTEFPKEVHLTPGSWFGQEVVIAVALDITERWRHQEQLEHIAHYDALTGLPNRVLLADRLHQAMAQTLRRANLLAVIYLDLDGFKPVNDTHGHHTGDELLVQLADRMKHALREGDTLARLGGDEFVAVLLDLPDRDAAIPVLERLLAIASAPIGIGDLVLRVSASLGITFYPQSEGMDADHLLRQADQAMYQAKQTGKNRYHTFDAEYDRAVRGHHESLERIREGLENRELVLHYQPKVNMRTGKVIGAEALIRWQHPQRGLLPPAAFLPVIESHPFAVKVGEWVLDAAMAQIETWRGQGIDLPISVNIDALHLQHPDFVSRLRTLLAAHPGVGPGDLELEVVETSALEEINQVSEVIRACDTLGVRFALDDFGTGYSSLTYLKRLPVEALKIDQSFVRDMLDDPDDLVILEGVLGLASAFRRRVIAEGVETTAHGRMLLQMGCQTGQGYAIARPMPPEAIGEWRAHWRPGPEWLNRTPLSREDLPILLALVEHRAWVLELTRYLLDDQETLKEPERRQCNLGRYLEDTGGRRRPDNPETERIASLHQTIHQQAETLLADKRHGGAAQVQSRIEGFRALQDELLELTLSLIDPTDTGPVHR